MTSEELNELLKQIEKEKCMTFIKSFYDGKDFMLPDGCLLVDGKPKTQYTGIDCMHAIATPAYVQGFDDGVATILDILSNNNK